MDFLDLFAGIGGFRMGLEYLGHHCVGFCEIDKFAQAVNSNSQLYKQAGNSVTVPVIEAIVKGLEWIGRNNG